MCKVKNFFLIILFISIIDSSLAMDKPFEKEKPSLSLFFKKIARSVSRPPLTNEEYLKKEKALKKINREKVELIDALPKLRTDASKFEVEAASLKAEASKREADAAKYKKEAEKFKIEALKRGAAALQLKEQADQHTNAAYATGTLTVVTGLIAVGTGGLSSALGLETFFGTQTVVHAAEAGKFSSLYSEADNASRQLISLSSEAENSSRQLISLSSETENKSRQLYLTSKEMSNKSNEFNNKIKELSVQEEIIKNQLKQIAQIMAYEDTIRTAQGKTYFTQTMSITSIFSNSDEEDHALADTSLSISIADHSLNDLRLAVEKAHSDLEDARGRAAYTRRCANSACHDADEACAARAAISKAAIATNAILNATTDATTSEIAAAVVIANADVIAKTKNNVDVIASDKKLASLLSEARYAEDSSREAQTRLRAAEESYEKANALFVAKNLSETLAKEAHIKIKLLSQNDPEFKTLNLNAHNIEEAMLIDFCRALEKNTFLEELCLDSNKITDLGAQWIFLALENNI